MDHAGTLVKGYLHVNGYFTVFEYPVVEARPCGGFRTAPDLDILAFRFPGAALGCGLFCAEMRIGEVQEGKAELNEAARDPAVLQAALHALVVAVVATFLKSSHSCCR